ANLTPVTSIYFCRGFCLAPGLAAALSTVVEGFWERWPRNQNTPPPTTTKPSANNIAISQVGKCVPPRGDAGCGWNAGGASFGGAVAGGAAGASGSCGDETAPGGGADPAAVLA